MKKWILALILLVVVIGVVLNKKANNAAFVAPEVAPILVEHIQPSWQAVRLTRPTQAMVKAEHEQLLTARMTAQVMELKVKEGDSVVAGEVIALLDDQNSRAEVSLATAELAQVQAERANIVDQLQASKLDLQAQKDTLSRLKKLAAIQAASEDQIQQQSVRVAQAEQRLSASQAQLKSYDTLLSAKRQQSETARSGLGYVRLTALQSGQVAERLVQVGDIVTAGTPLVRLISAGGVRRILVQLPADALAPAGVIYQDQFYALSAWPNANQQGLRTYEASVTDDRLVANQQMVMPLVVYEDEGVLIPSKCFIPRKAQQAQVLVNQQGQVHSMDIHIETVGYEGAVTKDARLVGQSLLCATSDVLIRLMAGRTFEVIN